MTILQCDLGAYSGHDPAPENSALSVGPGHFSVTHLNFLSVRSRGASILSVGFAGFTIWAYSVDSATRYQTLNLGAVSVLFR